MNAAIRLKQVGASLSLPPVTRRNRKRHCWRLANLAVAWLAVAGLCSVLAIGAVVAILACLHGSPIGFVVGLALCLVSYLMGEC